MAGITNITLDPTKTNVTAEIISGSPHVVGVDVVVFDAGSDTLETHTGKITATSSTLDLPLKKGPSVYKGCGIEANCAFESTDGTDTAPYKVTYQILLDGVAVTPSITLSGATSGGTATDTGVFKVN